MNQKTFHIRWWKHQVGGYHKVGKPLLLALGLAEGREICLYVPKVVFACQSQGLQVKHRCGDLGG